MTPSTQHEVEISHRRKMVAELYLRKHLRMVDIAEMLRVDRTTIVRDIAAIMKEWHDERIENVDIAVTAELARINELEHWAWEQETPDIETVKWCSTQRCKLQGLYSERKDESPAGGMNVNLNINLEQQRNRAALLAERLRLGNVLDLPAPRDAGGDSTPTSGPAGDGADVSPTGLPAA